MTAIEFENISKQYRLGLVSTGTLSRAEIACKPDEIVDFSGYERYLDTPVKRYSNLAEVLKNNTVIGKFLNDGKTALNGLYS